MFRVGTWIITAMIGAVRALCPHYAKTPPKKREGGVGGRLHRMNVFVLSFVCAFCIWQCWFVHLLMAVLPYHWGNVSAPGARRASFWTRAPLVAF